MRGALSVATCLPCWKVELMDSLGMELRCNSEITSPTSFTGSKRAPKTRRKLLGLGFWELGFWFPTSLNF